MNTEFFIAKRITFDKKSKQSISRPIIRICIFGISLGLAVMIISVAIVVGFRHEIRKKIIGFGSHIQIVNYDLNASFETSPISRKQHFYPSLDSIKGVKHIQVFATKPGIIKTKTDIQGAIVKGVGSDFDWSFFNENLIDGNSFTVNDTVKTNEVLISKYLSLLLKLKVGDKFIMYFIDKRPRPRSFIVSGIYETSLEEFDRQFILADIGHIIKLNNWEEDEISGFEVLIDNYDDIDYMTYAVRNIAGSTFNEDGQTLQVINIKQKYPQIFDWLNLVDKNVWIILGLMLIVAAFNMISGLLILILDRTNMIGILKAIGTKNRSIKNIFLYQSAFLMIKALFWGNIIGLGICWIQHYFKVLKLDQTSYFIDYAPINFNAFHIVILNVGTLVITMIILLLPSIIISNINPVKTIRFN
ncbi:MAG: ABC transporter permease [Bacteroidales bacterium]|nr:MAG: ABC transporter permease [Bacteroidales bacterium]